MKTLNEKKLERLFNKNLSLGLSEETSIMLAKQEIENDEVAFSNKMQRMTNLEPEHITRYDGIQLR